MKKIFFILLYFCVFTLYSQNIEISGGYIINRFHDFNYDGGHYRSSYEPGNGYSIMAGIDGFNLEGMKLRLTISYDKYGGKLEAYNGGLGGGGTTTAEIDKSVLSMGIFPLNFKIKKRLDINVGFELSVLLAESFSGTRWGWMMGQPPDGGSYSYDLAESYDRYSEALYFGLKGRIAYDFKISDTFVISPQYAFYLGLSKEFREFPYETKSMRHYFCIGFEKRIKTRSEKPSPSDQ